MLLNKARTDSVRRAGLVWLWLYGYGNAHDQEKVDDLKVGAPATHDAAPTPVPCAVLLIPSPRISGPIGLMAMAALSSSRARTPSTTGRLRSCRGFRCDPDAHRHARLSAEQQNASEAITQLSPGVKWAMIGLMADGTRAATRPQAVAARLNRRLRLSQHALSGDLPEGAAKAALLDSLKGAFGGDVNLIDNINIKAGVNAPDFSGLGAVFQAGAAIPDFNLNLDGDTITLAGTAASEDEKAAVEAAATAGWPNLKIANEIQITAPTGAPATPVPTPAPGPTGACANLQADINGLLRTPINFETDGFTLTPGTEQMLTQVADKLKTCPGSRGVAVNGYSDNTGHYVINVPLSGSRAKSVADFLVAEGVAGDVTSQGLGSANPIASNDTPEGKAQNRRVEITVS